MKLFVVHFQYEGYHAKISQSFRAKFKNKLIGTDVLIYPKYRIVALLITRMTTSISSEALLPFVA